MTPSHGASDWPPRRELSAPESHVLQHRGSAYADEPFRLAVKELVARRVLRIEPIRKAARYGRRTRYALSDGLGSTGGLGPALLPVLDLYRSVPQRTFEKVREGSTHATSVQGVLVKDLAKAARKRFRPTDRYREEHVVPELVRRGLLEVSGTRGFPRGRTTTGRRPDARPTPCSSAGSRWRARASRVGRRETSSARCATPTGPERRCSYWTTSTPSSTRSAGAARWTPAAPAERQGPPGRATPTRLPRPPRRPGPRLRERRLRRIRLRRAGPPGRAGPVRRGRGRG